MILEAVIDTGANFSIINKKIAETLNLPICIENKEKLVLANNFSISSDGNCKNIPIKLGDDKIYFCDAIVLEETAQKLLLGTNWLVKHKVIIDLDKGTLSTCLDGVKSILPITSIKTKIDTKFESESKEHIIPLRSRMKYSLQPFECQNIEVTVDSRLPENKFDCNSILYIENDHTKPYQIANGVFDCNTPIQKILVANNTRNVLQIQKNEMVSNAISINNGIVSGNITNKNTFDVNELLEKYKGPKDKRHIFEKALMVLKDQKIEIKELQDEHRIALNENNPQIDFKPYGCSLNQKEYIDSQIVEMLETDIIRESRSPYCSPIVLVKKPDGSWRFCVDYRQLNKFTIKDKYPLPRIDDTVDNLRNAKFFSKIDLKSGFWHIPIRESDKYLTAFKTHNGLYEWNKMPFGLVNAPSTFQRTMNNILNKLGWQFSMVYLDDIIIYSSSFDEHIEHVTKVLRELLENKQNLNIKKSEFFCNKINYLGYIIEKDNIKVCEEKINCVRFYPRPANAKKLQQFIGLT